MKLKHFLIVLGIVSAIAGLLWAAVEEQQCVTCTNGKIFVMNGDALTTGNTTTTGNATISGSATITGTITTSGGVVTSGVNAVTGADSLTSVDCGKLTTVTAGIDTATLTLPEASTVLGCEYTISYIGADAGALLDISPLDSDADGIEGGCTLAASVVTFSGTADADIGLTKATGLTGDFVRISSCGANMWCVTGCQGIWANN